MPRQRITRELLFQRAYDLLKEEGISAISAKSLAKAACCSVQPIYTYFSNMDELKDGLYQEAGRDYRRFLEKHVGQMKEPVKTGLAHVMFAFQCPHLFFLLFQQTAQDLLTKTFSHSMEGQGCLEFLLSFLQQNTQLGEKGTQYFLMLVHGVAAMVHSGLVKLDHGQAELILKSCYGELAAQARQEPAKVTARKTAPYSCFRRFGHIMDAASESSDEILLENIRNGRETDD